MKTVGSTLRSIAEQYAAKISLLPAATFQSPYQPGKWSRKQVLGHLIDSAQNNIRRMITSQYEAKPPQIIYEQNEWVQASDYQHMPDADVIQLWKLLNLQLATILETMPADRQTRLCNTGKDSENLHDLTWLARDYVRHLQHHLNQIIPGSFDTQYP